MSESVGEVERWCVIKKIGSQNNNRPKLLNNREIGIKMFAATTGKFCNLNMEGGPRGESI